MYFIKTQLINFDFIANFFMFYWYHLGNLAFRLPYPVMTPNTGCSKFEVSKLSYILEPFSMECNKSVELETAMGIIQLLSTMHI